MDIEWIKEILNDIKENKNYLDNHIGESLQEDKLRIELIRQDIEKIRVLMNERIR